MTEKLNKATQKKGRDPTARFWSRVDRSGGPNNCWPWTGCRLSTGYGQVQWNGRVQHTHRVAWQIAYSEIPRGKYVCHSCDSPPCCNPKHLFVGTQADNMKDKVAKGRQASGSDFPNRKGEAHPGAKLNDEDVREIRYWAADGVPNKELARKFKIDSSTATSVVNHKQWRHVSGKRPRSFRFVSSDFNRQTRARGEANSSAKMTAEKVREMRSLAAKGTPKTQLAKRFGIDQSTACDITNRKTWKHIL